MHIRRRHDAGQAPVLVGRPTRLRFRLTGGTRPRLGQLFRVTMFDPVLIGRFRVSGWVNGRDVVYVTAEALPGTLAHPRFTPVEPVTLDTGRFSALGE